MESNLLLSLRGGPQADEAISDGKTRLLPRLPDGGQGFARNDVFAFAGMILMLLTGNLFAATKDLSFTAVPIRQGFVAGDEEKFREQRWFREGYGGGMEEFHYEEEGLPEDLTAELSWKAIVRDNDYEGSALVKKENFGYVRFDFREFSKFYDGTGGTYYPFDGLAVNELDRDLELHIGRFSVEVGLTREDLPDVRLRYERRYKDGAKSRLAWTPVTLGGKVRNIGPSWQEIDEGVDIFSIEAEEEVKGFHLSGKQAWELAASDLTREERALSTTSAAANGRIRVQEQKPSTQLMTTTVATERWSSEEKVFTGAAYNFLHLTTEEFEDIYEMNANRVPTNALGNPKQIRGAAAETKYDAHTWTGNVMWRPVSWFAGIAKIKSELIDRHGESTYPNDAGPAAGPDGIINTTELSRTDDKAGLMGETLELRFSAIPRTVIYQETEFEQARNDLSEDRNSLGGQGAPSANEIFRRLTVTDIFRGIWTLGMRASPASFVDMTSHVRINRHNNDYEDKFETDPTGATARSAFIDDLDIETKEFASRVTFKVFKWLRPSFRYTAEIRDTISRVENEGDVETDQNTHMLTWAITLQPITEFLVSSSVSKQIGFVRTPSVSGTDAEVPTFRADYASWDLSGDYLLNQDVSLTSGLYLSRANNFNDFTSSGLPLGSDFLTFDIRFGFKWALRPNVHFEPAYHYYHYGASDLVDLGGGYNAHVVWLKSTLDWA